jgi:hypothetical protein
MKTMDETRFELKRRIAELVRGVETDLSHRVELIVWNYTDNRTRVQCRIGVHAHGSGSHVFGQHHCTAVEADTWELVWHLFEGEVVPMIQELVDFKNGD